MTGYALRKGLSFCCPDDHAVFLDIEADRYFGLNASLNKAFVAVVQNREPSREDLQALMAAGILVASSPTIRPVPCRRPKPTTPLLLTDVRASLTDVGSASLRRSLWRARLRLLPFARNMDFIGRSKRGLRHSTASPAIVSRLHHAYQWSARLFSTRDQCLATSFSLAAWSISLGTSPNLTLGVKLNPFQAHCWVEVEGTIVGDTAEHVQPFTPIWIG